MPLLTTESVAARLAVTPEHVVGLIRAGRLAASDVGLGSRRATWRIEEEEVERFLADSMPAPPKPRAKRRKPKPEMVQYF